MSYKNIGLLFCLLALINVPALDLTFDSKLTGWQTGFRAQIKVEKTTSSENAVLRMENKPENKRVSIHRILELEPDTEYKVSFWIKGENIQSGNDKGARILFNSSKKWVRISSLDNNMPDTGTFDWKYGESTINTGDFSDSKLRIELNLMGSGRVWIKNLKIEKKARKEKLPNEIDLSFYQLNKTWINVSNKSVKIDKQIKPGTDVLQLENNSQLWKTIELEKNTQYEFSYYIKGENIKNNKKNGAGILFNSGNKWRRFTGLANNQAYTGSFDWQKVTAVIDTSLFPSTKFRVILSLDGGGKVWFCDLKLVKKKVSSPPDSSSNSTSFHRALAEDIKSAALVPQGIFGFFAPNEPIKIQLHIEGKNQQYKYSLTVKNEYGKTVFSHIPKDYQKEFTIPEQSCGYYCIESDIYAAEKKVYTIQGGFAVTALPGKRDPFFQFGFGVVPELHDGYKRIGCGSIVIKTNWRQALATGNAKKAVDHLQNVAYKPFLESGDFHLSAALGTSLPRSVRSQEDQQMGLPLINDRITNVYLDFIKDFSSRIKISHWHIGQETPSNATIKKYVGNWSEAMAQFVALTRIAAIQLRKINPDVKILAGGNNIPAKLNDIEPIQMGDIVNYFDIYYIDAYTGNWDLTKKSVTIPEIALMDFYKAASNLSMQLGKGRCIANCETGYSVNYGAPFNSDLAQSQARLTARSLIISKAAPVLNYELFRPNDYNKKPKSDAEMHMATIWKTIPVNGQFHRVPMPGGAMYSVLTSELAFARIAKELINGNIYSYIFTKPDKSTLITLWNIEGNQQFAVKLPVGSKIKSMYGRDITDKPLVIGQDPIYITVPQMPQQVIPLIEQAIYSNAPEFKCVAQSDAVLIRSLLKTTREAEIHIPGHAPKKVKLFPDQVNRIPMKVTMPGKLISGNRQYDIPLEKIPVYTIKRVKNITDNRSKKPGVLRVPEHIRPIEALQPERCFFKSEMNPQGHNVSAKYWLGYDDNNFYLTVEVDDPIHQQRHNGKELWRDDSLQFVLSPQEYISSEILNNTDTRESSEYNFALALTSNGTQLIKYLGKDAGFKDYPAKVSRKNSVTRYEVSIPWSAVGGRAKRFGFLVWDNNSPRFASAPYRLEFSPGIAGGADSSKLARIKYE